MTPTPPRLATALLRACCSRARCEEIEGDLHELFVRQVERDGRSRARRAYVVAVASVCVRQLGARTQRTLTRPMSAGPRGRVYPLRVLACLAIGAALIAPLDEPWFVFIRNALLIAYPVVELLLLASVFGKKRGPLRF
jgi:hypothetical protein